MRAAAGERPVSAYIRERLFTDMNTECVAEEDRRLSPLERQRMLARILMAIGSSSISDRIAEFAELSRLGLLPNYADATALLRDVRDELSALRLDLLRALGSRPKNEDKP